MMFRWLPLLLPLLALPPGVLADPGPSMVTATKSRGVVETVHDTVVAPHESTYSYSTQLIGRLQGGAVLFDQTLAVPFADAAFQLLILTAQGVLTGAGAGSFGGPALGSSITTLTGSQADTVQTDTQSSVSNLTTTYVGPQTILVDDLGTCASYEIVPDDSGLVSRQVTSGCTGGTLWAIVGGGIDVDVMELTLWDVYTTTTTTDRYLTMQVYELARIFHRASLLLIFRATRFGDDVAWAAQVHCRPFSSPCGHSSPLPPLFVNVPGTALGGFYGIAASRCAARR